MGIPRDKWRDWVESHCVSPVDDQRRRPGELVRPGWGNVTLYGASESPLEEHADTRVVRTAIRQLEALGDAADGRPWCMYIGVSGPHDPFIVPESYASMYDPARIPLPGNYSDTLEAKPGVYRRMRTLFDQLSEREIREAIAHYWGYCTFMDDLLGETLQALERSGQYDDTLIVFVSDHGEHAGAHGLFAKGISFFDEGYRVPLILSWPGHVREPGSESEALVSLMDLAPTLLEAAQADPLERCAGRSLLPFLEGVPPSDWRSSLYMQCNGVEVFYTARMVLTEAYKFVYHPTDLDELYDRVNDPLELSNMAEEPGMAAVKKTMYRLLWEHALESEDTIFNPYLTIATADYGPGIIWSK